MTDLKLITEKCDGTMCRMATDKPQATTGFITCFRHKTLSLWSAEKHWTVIPSTHVIGAGVDVSRNIVIVFMHNEEQKIISGTRTHINLETAIGAYGAICAWYGYCTSGTKSALPWMTKNPTDA